MAAPPPLPPPSVFVAVADHLFAAKLLQDASFTFFIYDHIITFSDEVERIWPQNWSLPKVLFLLNRYVVPLQFIVGLDAFNDSRWTSAECHRFYRFEGSSTTGVIAIVELIMILRVYALYGRNNYLLAFLLTTLFAQVVVSSAAMFFSEPAPLPAPLVGCIQSGSAPILAALWIAPLVTDSIIFALTLFRIRKYLRSGVRMPLMHVFARDGTAYYFVIFCANLMNVLIYLLVSAPDVKPIGASFSQLITCTMISRLQLNLRSTVTKEQNLPAPSTHASRGTIKFDHGAAGARGGRFFTTGFLGGHVGDSSSHGSQHTEQSEHSYEMSRANQQSYFAWQ